MRKYGAPHSGVSHVGPSLASLPVICIASFSSTLALASFPFATMSATLIITLRRMAIVIVKKLPEEDGTVCSFRRPCDPPTQAGLGFYWHADDTVRRHHPLLACLCYNGTGSKTGDGLTLHLLRGTHNGFLDQLVVRADLPAWWLAAIAAISRAVPTDGAVQVHSSARILSDSRGEKRRQTCVRVIVMVATIAMTFLTTLTEAFASPIITHHVIVQSAVALAFVPVTPALTPAVAFSVAFPIALSFAFVTSAGVALLASSRLHSLALFDHGHDLVPLVNRLKTITQLLLEGGSIFPDTTRGTSAIALLASIVIITPLTSLIVLPRRWAHSRRR
mmetsp:Transcript_110455/g.191490  ORF Transcript_110455/g.191490 Transcript_110455/m.191490 type:complete len:333 (-) Transcript_110455:518-1516(-)